MGAKALVNAGADANARRQTRQDLTVEIIVKERSGTKNIGQKDIGWIAVEDVYVYLLCDSYGTVSRFGR